MINVARPALSRKPQAYAIAGRLGLGDAFRNQASTKEKNFIRASGVINH